MRYVADLHLHSPYARASSRFMTFGTLAYWARRKGIDLLASADFTHPVWLEETARTLQPVEGDLFEHGGVRFVLGTEVNCSFQRRGRRHNVHMLAFVPGLEAARRLAAAVAPYGDLAEDGRPSLAMTARDFVEAVGATDPRSFVIAAHVWTPWYSALGSWSGFDSLEACFEDMAPAVFCVETGLSSDPAMNWRVADLDSRTIVSFSDAHSPPRLGREVTVIDGDLTFDGLREALRRGSVAYTVEFYPEEGKYHWTGHRGHVKLPPGEVRRLGKRCPVCGRRMTVGVADRVEALASRAVTVHRDADGFLRGDAGRPPYRLLVPLQEILAEALGVKVGTKTVDRAYEAVIDAVGPELSVLQEAPLEAIARAAGERVAQGVDRVRRGEISIDPGYDNTYGVVRVWPEAAE
ncbi:MAG TPA: endonuclease Q family protein [Dehalococcoidia bacterium]